MKHDTTSRFFSADTISVHPAPWTHGRLPGEICGCEISARPRKVTATLSAMPVAI